MCLQIFYMLTLGKTYFLRLKNWEWSNTWYLFEYGKCRKKVTFRLLKSLQAAQHTTSRLNKFLKLIYYDSPGSQDGTTIHIWFKKKIYWGMGARIKYYGSCLSAVRRIPEDDLARPAVHSWRTETKKWTPQPWTFLGKQTSLYMQHKLSLLKRGELHDLFLSESLRFTEGMDNGLPFDELKKIRTTLREITLTLQEMNGLSNGS